MANIQRLRSVLMHDATQRTAISHGVSTTTPPKRFFAIMNFWGFQSISIQRSNHPVY